MTITKYERQLGLICGAALGDAFGMATEMMTRDEIKQLNLKKGIIYPSFPNSKISKNSKAGSITDDTYNFLIVQNLIKNSISINAETYLEKLIEWKNKFKNSDYVIGPSTSKAINAYLNNQDLDKVSMFGITNGSLMKIAPLGLKFSYNNLDLLIENVYKLTKITHNTTVAIQSASMIAALTNYLYEGNPLNYEILILFDNVLKCCKNYGYNWSNGNILFKIKQALNIIESEQSTETILDRLNEEIGTSMNALDTISCVIALLFLSKGNINDYCYYSMCLGGDTDTIGSIGASLCGIYNPTLLCHKQIQLIENVNKINFKNFIIKELL